MPYHAETIVVGCGNILFKDDGFGPFVIHKLEEYFEVEIILERYERKRDKVLLEIDWELKGKEVEITVEDSIYILKLFKGLQSLENTY